jgi:hypothetical protein
MFVLDPPNWRCTMQHNEQSDLIDRLAAAVRRLPPTRQARFVADLEEATDQAVSADWISQAAAARLLALDPRSVKKLADSGRLTIRCMPFGKPRLLKSEVLALVEEATRPSKQGA